MAKSIKLTNNQYWDSSAVVTNSTGANLKTLFYDSTTSYAAGDVVLYNAGGAGSEHYQLYVYIFATASSNHLPTDTTYWAPVFVA